MELALRLIVVVGLGTQAVIHLKLAPDYQLGYSDGIGGGNLFRIEAVVAILAGAYLLARGSRPAYLLAAVVALGGLAAVVLYRYVDIGSFGPIPGMYEPIWFFEKNLSAVAEGVAGTLALLGAVLVSRADSSHGESHSTSLARSITR